MQQRSNSFYLDVTTLIVSIVLLISLLFLPYMAMVFSGSNVLTVLINPIGRELMDLVSDGQGSILYLILVPLLGGFVVLLGAIFALMNPQRSRTVAWLTLMMGLLIIPAQILQIVMGVPASIGFWIIIVCGVYFVVQAFLPRDNVRMNMPLTPAEGIILERPARPLTSPQPAPAPAPAPQQRPRVDAWLIDNNNNFFQLFQGQNLIGRSADNDLVLNESSISRHHAVIYEQNGSFIIQNRSTNQDVLVNGVPLNNERRTLEKNDTIGLGEMTYTFILR